MWWLSKKALSTPQRAEEDKSAAKALQQISRPGAPGTTPHSFRRHEATTPRQLRRQLISSRSPSTSEAMWWCRSRSRAAALGDGARTTTKTTRSQSTTHHLIMLWTAPLPYSPAARTTEATLERRSRRRRYASMMVQERHAIGASGTTEEVDVL